MFFGGIYFIAKLLFLQLYPAYICYKAIKADNPAQFGPLLTYWVVVSCFLVAEYIADFFLFWVPFYTDIKFLFILWLMLPQTQGTRIVYQDWLEPLLTHHEAHIDKSLVEIKNRALHHLSVYAQTILHTLRNIIVDNMMGKHEKKDKDIASISEVHAPSSFTIASTSTPTSASEAIPKENWDLKTVSPFTLFSTFIVNAPTIQTPSILHDPIPLTDKDSEETTKVERSDSFDSLASFVSGPNKQAKGMPLTSGSKDNEGKTEEKVTWMGYFGGWGWKASSEVKKDGIQEAVKQD
ncbi:TB2/DP1, HVA22 family-domain-containing protein [Spinellus fusiger]|nr:TB2/DP1, HVA22 family-domain-containing protein [Spinellus fusiger]